jgi:uncharacterized protein
VTLKTIWILSHTRAGDLDQMLALARALDWPATVKRLAFRTPKLAAIPFLAKRLFDPARSDSLEPPWPDLVVCAEGRASAIARLIKSRSHGMVKTVCLGRPAGTPANFDLVLTTPQYRLRAGPNIVELALPLPPQVRTSGEHPPEYPRPVTAVLLGGTSLPERLDRQAAAVLASDLMAQAEEGTCVFITSPRTDPAAAAALAEAVPAPHIVHLWQRGGDNPYWHVLTAADRVVVTSDSVSMVMDALAAGKPVSVYRLPRHHTARNRVVNWLHGRKGAAWLFDHGIIEIRPDRHLLFDKLAAQGQLDWFGEAPPVASTAPEPIEDTAIAVAKVRQLFSDDDAC